MIPGFPIGQRHVPGSRTAETMVSISRDMAASNIFTPKGRS